MAAAGCESPAALPQSPDSEVAFASWKLNLNSLSPFELVNDPSKYKKAQDVKASWGADDRAAAAQHARRSFLLPADLLATLTPPPADKKAAKKGAKAAPEADDGEAPRAASLVPGRAPTRVHQGFPQPQSVVINPDDREEHLEKMSLVAEAFKTQYDQTRPQTVPSWADRHTQREEEAQQNQTELEQKTQRIGRCTTPFNELYPPAEVAGTKAGKKKK